MKTTSVTIVKLFAVGFALAALCGCGGGGTPMTYSFDSSSGSLTAEAVN
jgi:hypothetical protein